MSGLRALLVTMVVGAVSASPQDLWQRFQQQERARQAARAMEVGPYAGIMLDQYYPLWSQAAVLQLDEPNGRFTEPEADDDDDYGYEMAPELTYGDEGDNVATGVEEQIYKDLLLRYLLREMDKQEALPVVRRRSQYRTSRTEPMADDEPAKALPSSTSTTTTTTTTASPVKSAVAQVLTQQQKGQKEVALLRPPSANRPLTWPQELENKQRTDRDQQKRMPERIGAPSTAPKKHPKEAMDILTAQLNSLRSRAQ